MQAYQAKRRLVRSNLQRRSEEQAPAPTPRSSPKTKGRLFFGRGLGRVATLPPSDVIEEGTFEGMPRQLQRRAFGVDAEYSYYSGEEAVEAKEADQKPLEVSPAAGSTDISCLKPGAALSV